MKFIWEPEDFNPQNNWGLMASKGEETVIVGGCHITSLRDGHHWEYGDREEAATDFNKHGYIPVFAPVNASVVMDHMKAKKFGYGNLSR